VTRRRWWLLGLAVIALVWALGGEWINIHKGIQENHFLDAMVGLSYFAAGIVALDRRPGNAIGTLMIAYAMTWFLANWGNLAVPVLPVLGLIANDTQAVLLAHIALAYPSGHVRARFDRFVLATMYVVAVGTALAIFVTFGPRAFGCTRCEWEPALFASWRVFRGVQTLNDRLGIVLTPLFFTAIILRWRRASRAERRDLAPLWIAVSLLALNFLLASIADPNYTDNAFSYLLWELRGVLEIAGPCVFLWGLLSTRLARSAVGDLVVELERPMPPGGLRDALARTLGDPSLEVAYAIGSDEPLVDADGQRVTLPELPADRRAVTTVAPEREPLAVLIHDPALDEGLVRASGAAAGMAIANERLRAQVRAQLEEVRASRQRIVEAGDRERRRVERNLHDGAQQRLVTISLGLAMLQQRDGLDPETGEAVAHAIEELRSAMGELRELARGIHPAILTEEGLVAAVEMVADRSSVPVRVHVAFEGRFPEPVEATAYYVVSESIANVAKYADASAAYVGLELRNGSLCVEVADDGKGGADVDRGSGLRGLEDRVAAVGGTFRIESPRGEGTRVFAEIPTDA
jgi:signal transduction histidine kinase